MQHYVPQKTIVKPIGKLVAVVAELKIQDQSSEKKELSLPDMSEEMTVSKRLFLNYRLFCPRSQVRGFETNNTAVDCGMRPEIMGQTSLREAVLKVEKI